MAGSISRFDVADKVDNVAYNASFIDSSCMKKPNVANTTDRRKQHHLTKIKIVKKLRRFLKSTCHLTLDLKTVSEQTEC